jgi:PAS domain S-box-containing protein
MDISETSRNIEYDLMKYKLTSDALNVALWDMEIPAKGPVTPDSRIEWSREFRAMLGFEDGDEFPDILRSWSERLHPEDSDRTLEAFSEHINDKTGQTPFNREYRLLTKDGEYRFYQAFGTTLRGEGGVPLRVAGALMDITDRVLMENVLRRREELMFVQNNIAEILLSTEDLMDISKPLSAVLEIVGQTMDADHVLIWKDVKDPGVYNFVKAYEWLSEYGRNETTVPGRLSFTAEEGALLFQNGENTNSHVSQLPDERQKFYREHGIKSIIIIPLYLQEEFWGFFSLADCRSEHAATEDEMGALRSISLMMASAANNQAQAALLKTTAKRLEEALEEAKVANRAKSEFLANMSHEMRTPLNSVIGLTWLCLENEGIDGITRSNLEKIHNSGSTLLGIVNDILDISKIESGKLELINVEYDVPSVINDTVTQNLLRINEKPIEFKLNADENMPSRLFGDELRLKQIMNNLVSNAIKYTREGEVELSVSCERENGDIWLIISVRDTGQGIKPDDLKKLFTDYAQVDTKANRKIEGTGLGLSITRKLCDMMDGAITVESVYGQGSVFTARVRQGFVTDVPIGRDVVQNLSSLRYSDGRRDKTIKLQRVSLPHARVLVVDDNHTNLDVARGLLKPYKMRVDCADSGIRAVEAMVDEGVYDAVFMDQMMPEMDGIEAAARIRALGTDYAQNIPIIALTANAIVGNEEIFLNNGFQAFLTKPIDIMRLDEVVRTWVRNKAAEGSEQQTEAAEAESPQFKINDYYLDGLDINRAMAQFDGDWESYVHILKSYLNNTRKVMGLITEVSMDNIRDYEIYVHGLKGSSQGICAYALGNMAAGLEEAAKSGNIVYILNHNPVFVEAAKKFTAELEIMLNRIDDENPKPKRGKPDGELLAKLCEACDEYDTDAVDDLIAALNEYRYTDDDGLVEWLNGSADAMEYMEIAERLKGII